MSRQGGLSPRTAGAYWMILRCFKDQLDVSCTRHTCVSRSPFLISCRYKGHSGSSCMDAAQIW